MNEIMRTDCLVIEERNTYAVEICKRIRDKLDGSDPDSSVQSSISDQVKREREFISGNRPLVCSLGSLHDPWSDGRRESSNAVRRMDIMGLKRVGANPWRLWSKEGTSIRRFILLQTSIDWRATADVFWMSISFIFFFCDRRVKSSVFFVCTICHACILSTTKNLINLTRSSWR